MTAPSPLVVHVWDVGLPVPLSEVLAGYLGCDAADVAIERTEGGKPYVVDGPRFSVTHSGGRALVAVTSHREVGVDLEVVRPRKRVAGVAGRWFSEAERRYVDAHDPDDRLAAFYRVWTAKEACVKASGAGLQGMEATSVALRRSRPWTTTADGRWSVRTLDVGPGWAAALAVAGAERRPRVRLRRREA